MRFLKHFALATLLVCMLSLLVACGAEPTPPGGTSGPQKPFTIGVSNSFVGSEWRTQMIQGLQDANAAYMQAGLTKELIIQSADTDSKGQEQQIQSLIDQGVNAIIVNPGSVSDLDRIFQRAVAEGIIVIAVDQAVDTKGVVNVVIDQTEWARMSAKWLAEQLKGKGNVVIENGISGHPANEARYNGVKEVFGQYPDIKILNEVNANWDQATGQQKMSDLLASQPNIDAVWTQDGMARGVLQAIQTANPPKWPIVVGEARSGYMELWKQIKDQRSDFVSYGVVNPPGCAVSGLRIALELLQGKKSSDFKEPLKGAAANTLFIPIPGVVDANNFEAEYAKIQGKQGEYVLDGFITEAEAKAYFK